MTPPAGQQPAAQSPKLPRGYESEHLRASMLGGSETCVSNRAHRTPWEGFEGHGEGPRCQYGG